MITIDEVPAPSTAPGRVTILGAMNVAFENWRMIATCMVTAFAVVAAAVFFSSRQYASHSSFIPQSRRSTPSVAGLAAQFGIAVPGAEPGQSPAFYSDLIESREILGQVVMARFADSTLETTDSVILMDILAKGPRPVPLRREAAIRKLRMLVTPNVSIKTGVVELAVVTGHPAISKQVNQRILDLVNAFNLEKRQSQAAFERRFAERRVEEVRQEVRVAEDRLQAFLLQNRDYRNSPVLTFQHDRLERDVGMRQQVFTSLAQAFEQAKLEEIRDTPVITVIETPETPLLPEARGLVKKSALAMIAGLLFGLALAFGNQALRDGRLGSAQEKKRFAFLFHDIITSVPLPWRRVKHSSDI